MTRVKNYYEFKYEISEDQRCVTCTAKVKEYDNKFMNAVMSCYGVAGKYPKSYYFDDIFTGVAHFKNGDESDLKFAAQIARAKALRKANRIMAQVMYECEQALIQKARFFNSVKLGTICEGEKYNRMIECAVKDKSQLTEELTETLPDSPDIKSYLGNRAKIGVIDEYLGDEAHEQIKQLLEESQGI